ncbi:MAG: dihydrofolate reductase family protein [Alistipes sp.]
MNIFASVAVTRDGALDDCTATQLRISSTEDWAEVLRLRGQFDAILVGAETLRRDNPRLVIDNDELRTQRTNAGLLPDITKVTITESGCLAPDARFFTCGTGRKIVFSTHPLPHLAGLAEVIVAVQITAAFVVTELEKLGIGSLFVEGGVQVLRMFFAEKMVNTLRLAVNPELMVGDVAAPHLDIGDEYLAAPSHTAHFGTTQVTTYALRCDVTRDDWRALQQAIDVSRSCTKTATSYCVGAVIITRDGRLFKGYTHETSPTHHAEQEVVAKALEAGVELRGATIYSSMEPCSSRKSEPESCSEMIIRLGFSRVVFALYEPDCFVACRGAFNLRRSGVAVAVIPALAEQVKAINAHLWR